MVSHILSDIEGTSTSIAYVHEVLFPFALANIESYLKRNKERPEIKGILETIRNEHFTQDKLETQNINDIICILKNLIKSDVKYGPLKTIQGLMWKEGYQDGLFKGHVYPDVKNQLIYWNQKKIKVSIYSSGSIEAQKLLFSNSTDGDLSQYIFKNFDTLIGPKQQTASYQLIARELSADPSQILFLSDVFEELVAAESAGFKACQLIRGEVKKSFNVQAKDFKEVTEKYEL